MRPRYSDIQISRRPGDEEPKTVKKSKEEDPWIYVEAMPVAQCLGVLGRLSSDDIADRVTPPDRPAKVGSLFGILQAKGYVREVAKDQKFYSRHHSRIAMYEGTEANSTEFKRLVREGLILNGVNADIFEAALTELGFVPKRRRLKRIGESNGNQEGIRKEGALRG